MKINKIKELKTRYKLLICIVITIISAVCIQPILNNWDSKVESFDYSKIYSISGVITEVGWEHDYDFNIRPYSYHTSAYMNVRLENDETIKIGLGGSTGNYSEGENITIYTDGTHYFTTQYGVASDAQLTIFNLLGACVIMFFALAVWIWLFGWKGFLIGLFVSVIILTWGEV